MLDGLGEDVLAAAVQGEGGQRIDLVGVSNSMLNRGLVDVGCSLGGVIRGQGMAEDDLGGSSSHGGGALLHPGRRFAVDQRPLFCPNTQRHPRRWAPSAGWAADDGFCPRHSPAVHLQATAGSARRGLEPNSHLSIHHDAG